MTERYGLVAADGTPKEAFARVARWNDKTRRHTLYTVCGTQQDGWGIFNAPTTEAAGEAWLELYNQILLYGNPSATPLTELPEPGTPLPSIAASPDTVVGANADEDLFNWVPVSYPASTPFTAGRTTRISMADSIKVGVTELTGLIRATPGTFAMVGMSQGAAVMSNVLKTMLPGGDLYYRMRDCIGAVAFGNPMRKAGVPFPGGTAPAGAGILSPVSLTANPMLSGLANADLPSWWWEMVTPNDFFADVPTEHLKLISSVARTLATYKGVSDPLSMAGNLINAFTSNATALEYISVLLVSVVEKLLHPGQPSDIEEINAWLDAHFGDDPTFVPDPHTLYGVLKPPTLPTGLAGVDSTSTYIDVAAAYIQARGTAVTPR